jgi:2-isopropylmalate synthase
VAKTAKYAIQNDSAMMQKILDRVQDLENEGFQFEAAEASFDLLVRKIVGQYVPKFEKVHYRVNVESDGGLRDDSVAVVSDREVAPATEATIKLRVAGKLEHVVAEGDGPVNALDTALRKALIPAYPNLAEMQLVDYKVRVINSTAGTAARVRVVIESRDAHEVWTTVGVSENIIEASWLALVDSVEYKLFKDETS